MSRTGRRLTAGPFGHGAADATHADNPERLVGDLPAEHLVPREGATPPLLHNAAEFGRAPACAQDEKKRQIGRAFRHHVRRVSQDETPGLRGGNVEVVESDAACRDDLHAVGQSVDVLGPKPQIGSDEKGLRPSAPPPV